MSLALSLCQYVLRPRRGLAQASPGLAQASPSLKAPRLQAFEARDLLHQHNRKGQVVMIKTRRSKRLVFGFVFCTLNWYEFWRRSGGLPCSGFPPLCPWHLFSFALAPFCVWFAVFLTYWGGPPLGVQILCTFPTPKTGMEQIEQFNMSPRVDFHPVKEYQCIYSRYLKPDESFVYVGGRGSVSSLQQIP